MKITASLGIATLLGIGALAIIYSFSSNEPNQQWEKKDNGTIGDVKYSVLNPEQFRIVNGDGWVLLDGTLLNVNSDLYKLLHSTGHGNVIPNGKLPNADGVFIRGVDTNEEDTYGDPQKSRVTGGYQPDAFQGHKHINSNNIAQYYSKQSPNNPKQRHNVTGTAATNSAGNIDAGHEEPRIANETRPKNICLYTYIKINN